MRRFLSILTATPVRMSTCSRCIERPGSHSFVPVLLFGGCTYIYTAPARAEHITTEGQFAIFKAHLEPYRAKPWVWIMDCRNMTTAHYMNTTFTKLMMTCLANEHASSLQSIWILNAGVLMHGSVAFLQTFLPGQTLQKLCVTSVADLENVAPKPLREWLTAVDLQSAS
jgi:hypothetical protein